MTDAKNTQLNMVISADLFFVPMLEQVSRGAEVKLKVTGNSMWPFFSHTRDYVYLSSCDTQQIKKYDILLYKRKSGKYVLHRVCRIENGVLSFIGDNQYIIEKDILPEQVLACVKRIERKGRLIKCNSFGWRICSKLWTDLLPVRGTLIKLIRRINLIRRRFRRG